MLEPFDIILMDPPWNYYGSPDKWAAAGKHYALMADEDLKDMDIASMMHKSSVLFMWATCPRLDGAIDCMRAWDLHYRGVAFVWVKTKLDGTPIGARGVRPSITKPLIELVLAASKQRRGRPMPVADESIVQTVLAPVKEHSVKPEAVQDRIELLYPESRKLEMFARRERDGWTCWGDEL